MPALTKLLVMEGNTRDRQEASIELGMRTASGIYKQTINALYPEITVDVLQGVDGFGGMPRDTSMEDYDGLVIGGSGLRCADDTPAVTLQIEFLRQFAKTGRPVLGSCWGLQIAVVAAGGSVRPSPNGREIVIARKLGLTDAGKEHAFYKGKSQIFDAPCTHYDEIDSLPTGSTLLCTNAHSEVQGALVPLEKSVVWGVQYHPEFDLQHLADLLRLYGDSTIRDGFFNDRESKDSYTQKLESLAANPDDAALAWQLGIDNDLLRSDLRSAEIGNWIQYAVLPD